MPGAEVLAVACKHIYTLTFKMKHLQDASKELMSNLIFALDHSMDLKKDGVDPMIPFAVVIKGTDKTIKTFVGDSPEYADQMFERTIREEKPDYVVFATDSYLTTNGIKYDAVLLKAYDKNDTEIYLVGQKFKPKTNNEDFEQIGNPGFLGTELNNFNSSGTSTINKRSKPWWRVW
jgi:hypothetical protein